MQGLVVLVLIVVNAGVVLRRIMRRAGGLPPRERDQVRWLGHGLVTALAAVLTYGMTGTLVYTEYLWWFLALPICLERAVANLEADSCRVAASRKETSQGPRKTAASESG